MATNDVGRPGLISAPEPKSLVQKIVTNVGWIALGFFCFLVSIYKLPEDRLKNFIQGNVTTLLAGKGISLIAGESGLSIGFGVSYVMKDVILNFPPPDAPAHIDKISVSPSLTSLFLGKLAGDVSLSNAGGSFSASFSTRGDNVSISFKSKRLDLGKIGLLPVLAGIKGSAVINGSGDISGDLKNPGTFQGDTDLNLTQITIDQQSIAGFSIPRLNISKADVELDVEKGKATIKTFKLGKADKATEDIQATVSGDVTLGKQWETSQLNLKTRFSFSENVMKAFVLLDALLGQGKQADGSYSYTVTGPATNPNPQPVAPGGA